MMRLMPLPRWANECNDGPAGLEPLYTVGEAGDGSVDKDVDFSH